MKSFRIIFILALAVISVGIIASICYYRDRDRHPAYSYERAGGDTISVAIAYSPMSLYRYGDSITGFNYEMMRAMAAEYGDNVKFFPVSSVDEALAMLREGRFDVVMADIPKFASGREHYLFTVPVYTDKQVLVGRDTISSTLDLAGKEVWVAAGSPAVTRLENLSREIGDSIDIHVSTDYSAEQLVILTAKGEIPRAVVNQEVARRLSEIYPDIRISDNISFSQFQSWILDRRSKVLLDTLDNQIGRFMQTPVYRSLTEKWGLATPLRSPAPESATDTL
ncbi:MAG: transporter substrate-binding domain-containing protein [Muribaculaceae bacterium]|nr:transporter substrate-binding domain-containing protein [Muribaculaceae bacterium]